MPSTGGTIVLDAELPAEQLKQITRGDGNAEEEKKLLEKKLQESYEKGRRDVLEKIKKDEKKDIALTCQSVHKSISDLKQESIGIWSKCEKEIVKLTLAIAKKIVLYEVSKNGSKIIEMIANEAINMAKDKKILKLYMNPEDIENLRQLEVQKVLDDNVDYEICSDSGIETGGCKIVTDYGCVDARLETRFKEIENSFEEHIIEKDLENDGRKNEPT